MTEQETEKILNMLEAILDILKRQENNIVKLKGPIEHIKKQLAGVVILDDDGEAN